MPASISGLGSGLDTDGIISQLMQIERIPQQRLASQKLAVLSQGTAWGQIGVALNAMTTAAGKLTGATTFAGVTAASSTPTVASVTAAAGASPGTHSVSVQALATAGSSSRTVASPTAVVGAGSLVATRGTQALGITAVTAPSSIIPSASGAYSVEVMSVDGNSAEVMVNGVRQTVDLSGGAFTVNGLTMASGGLNVGKAEVTVARTTSPTATVQDLANALNQVGGVASASVVPLADGTTKLLLASTQTGLANDVSTTVDGLSGLGVQETVAAASDARLTLDGLAGITSPTNRVTGLLPGVTLDLVTAGPASTQVTVAKDPASGVAAVRDLVNGLNSALNAVSTNTKYNLGTSTKSPLTGDSAARQLSNQLQSAVSQAGAASTVTLGAAGITLQRDGTYKLDETALAASLAADPRGTATLVQSLGSALTDVASQATAVSGAVTVGKDSATSRAAGLQTQVDSFGDRLTLTEARLRRTYTQLDTVLGQLRSQSGYLSSQLAGLSVR